MIVCLCLAPDVWSGWCGCEWLEAAHGLQEWLLPQPSCHSVVLEGNSPISFSLSLSSPIHLAWWSLSDTQPQSFFCASTCTRSTSPCFPSLLLAFGIQSTLASVPYTKRFCSLQFLTQRGSACFSSLRKEVLLAWILFASYCVSTQDSV